MAESSYYSKGEQMAWDDREIIAQFLCRDEAAIKNTADKYERYCSSIAYRILENGEDVRECLNDTWLKLWESIPPTVPEILSAYVGKITRNLAINRYDHLHAGKRCGDSVDQPLEELKECASLAHDNVTGGILRKQSTGIWTDCRQKNDRSLSEGIFIWMRYTRLQSIFI